jgi:hypothetical protein
MPVAHDVSPKGVGYSGGEHVGETLNRPVAELGKPKFLFADNGAEFMGRLMDMGRTTKARGSTSAARASPRTTRSS